MDTTTITTTDAAAAAAYEETHVHGIYEAIAPHFSATRHTPWPFVARFLAAQPAGAVGLDIGCGNGKNMGAVNRDVVMLGCDRSAALVKLAASAAKRNEVAVADGLYLPFREACADFVICIAVVHHLSTRARRVEALRQLLRCVNGGGVGGGGQVLVYVWALEQSSTSRRRELGEGGEQDLLVPWVMKKPQQKKDKTTKNRKQHQQQHQQQGEGGGGEGSSRVTAAASLAAAAEAAAAADEAEEHKKKQDETRTCGNSGAAGNGHVHTAGINNNDINNNNDSSSNNEDKTFHRFYHLYRKGELEEDVVAAGGQVLSSGYERDNWWVIAGC